MYSGNQEPVQSQPPKQYGTTTDLNQLSKRKAVVPPGLECLVEVEEVILKKKVFQTMNGQTLFSVRQESECFGPSFNFRLRDPYKRNVVSLYQESSDCCGGQNHVKISSLGSQVIGFVRIAGSSSKLSVSMEMGNSVPVFHTQLPLSLKDNSTIEIIGMEGSHPVSHIVKNQEGVLFHFPMDMEATMKALILGAFLYMSFRVQEVTAGYTSDYRDDSWATAGGLGFVNLVHHQHNEDSHWSNHHDPGHGGHHGDCGDGWGGDSGGGDCGGGGGDCGGGGGDCGGGGGDF